MSLSVRTQLLTLLELVMTLARLTSLRRFPLCQHERISIDNRPNRGLLRQKHHSKRQMCVCEGC